MTEENSSAKKAKRTIKLSFVTITALFFIFLLGFSWLYNDSRKNASRDDNLLRTTAALTKATAELTAANAERIKDIQNSRTSSCKQTYRGIREVFKPFIPSHPTSQRQIETIDAFNANIDRLIQGCVHQTDPNKEGQ